MKATKLNFKTAPNLSNEITEFNTYTFTLSGINVSLANSIRRTILSSIPMVVFHTEPHTENKCIVECNTSRLHNEILKHRLSCIPIHSTKLDELPGNYLMELDVTNETDHILYVTTGDFRVKNKQSGQYLSKEDTAKLFPKCAITDSYIDFARLRPKISVSIPGERIKLSCEFSVASAEISSTYNAVSKCTYMNTIDQARVSQEWDEREAKYVAEKYTAEEIEYEKKNFHFLDAQRYFVPDSFDFTVESVGVYENKDIVKKACAILQSKFIDLIEAIDADTIPILESETTIDHCYDIILEGEDYTIGKVMEYILYSNFYEGEKMFSYCGFVKLHPHDTSSRIRVAYREKHDKSAMKQHLRSVCVDAQEFYKIVYGLF